VRKAECRCCTGKKPSQWRRRNRGYAIAYRIDQRATQTESPAEPMRVPAHWTDSRGSSRKTSSGPNAQISLGFMGALMVRTAKDEFRAYLVDPTRLFRHTSPPSRKTSSDLGIEQGAQHVEPGRSNRRWQKPDWRADSC